MKRFDVISASFLRRIGLGVVFLLGCTAALAWFALPQSAFTFLTGGENPQPKSAAVAPASKSVAIKRVTTPQRQDVEKNSQDGVWREIEFESLAGRVSEGIPAETRALELDKKSLVKILDSAPNDSAERLIDLSDSKAILQLPLPDGGFMRFRLADSPVMNAEMVKNFPEIKSYRAQGADDLRVSARISFSPRGLHATILTHDKLISVHPARYDDTHRYVSYYGEDFNSAPFSCGVTGAPSLEGIAEDLSGDADAPNIATGATLRKYRFAVAVTQEYYNDLALGGKTYQKTVDSIIVWMNAVNVIYERELAVRLEAFTDSQIVFTAEPDGFTNGISGTMHREAQDILANAGNVGLSRFDIGHVFGKDGDGGVAVLGATCRADKLKGGGATGLSAMLGNAGSLIVLAHEIGHQFGAPHTWNGCNNGARVHSATAYEVGSGSTIMGYGGTCENDNLLGESDLRFHAISLKNMNDYLNSANQCAVPQATGNAAPVVDAGAGYTIPKLTPFALTASATDANDDVKNLTYTWEQFDAGGALYPNPPYGDQPGDPETTTRPIFRAYSPTSNPTRIFPSLEYILNNANTPPETVQIPWGNGTRTRQVGEKLPSVGRTLKFRVTARDNRSGGGGTNDDDVRITVAGGAGPFAVTAPNIAVTWSGGTTQPVQWDVKNTNIAPVSAANVKISLSTDGGQTFPVVLANSTLNDGSETVNIPNGIQTATARVKVEAVGNIFFDISDANFTINNADTCPIIAGIAPGAGSVGTEVVINGKGFDGVTAVTFGGGVTAPILAGRTDTEIKVNVPAGATSGAITLTESACSPRQTAPFSVCTSSPQPLSVDDGVQEGNYPDKYHVNRLTPTNYPATLTHVQIYFHNGSNNAIVGEEFTILAGTNADGDTNINNTAFQSLTANVKTIGNFNTYALPVPITITQGDFVIGYKLTTGRSGSGDNTAPKSRSYYSNGDSTSLALTNGTNYMIRGQYSTSCAVPTTISPAAQEFNASAGDGSIAVTASTAWTATRNNSWITINSGASGTNNGTVIYSVEQNNTGATRTGTITVAGQTFTVTQTACVIGFSPFPSTTVGAAGGTFDVTVSAPAGCSWMAASNTNWITVNSGTSGTNNGTISYNVQANAVKTGRTGTLTIAGQTLIVTQTACPDSATMIFDDDGGFITSGTYFVSRLTPTSYPATLTHAQIYFHGDTRLDGNNVQYGVPLNQTVTILAGKNTDGNDNIDGSIQQAFDRSSGTVRDAYTSFELPTPITISSGDFVIGFKIAPNRAVFPMATENIAPVYGRAYRSSNNGQTFSNVPNEDFRIRGVYKSFCTDGTIAPTSQAVSGSGASGTVSVTASVAWTAHSNDPWIIVTSGASGTGNGTVDYTVAQNTAGAPRTGSITIAGQVFTVTQDACGIVFTPSGTTTINAPGGTFNIAVTTPAGCAWTATTGTPWITINSGVTGSGSGTIKYSIPKNSVTANRTGAITIAGQTLSVTQLGCPGNSETMIFDDDVVSSGGSGGYNVVRLMPTAYPATLTHVQVYLSDSWGTAGREFKIVSGKNTDSKTNINGLSLQEMTANSGTTRNKYVSFALTTPIIISKGEFVVGFKVTEANGFFPLASETIAPLGRSYYWNGATFVNVTSADFKIRGEYKTDCPSGSISSSASPNFSNSGGSGTVNVTADGTWTAFSDDDWIMITGSANRADDDTADYDGTGNGTVTYTVAPNNSGVARTGSMSIAGNVFIVNQGLAPTATAVDIGGRVLTDAGKGIGNARVFFTASDGSARSVSTNSFGYYRFADVPSGQSYVITAQSRRYWFAPRILTLNEAVDDLNIIAEP